MTERPPFLLALGTMVGRISDPSYHHATNGSARSVPSRAIRCMMVGRIQDPSYHHATYVSAWLRPSRDVRRKYIGGVGAFGEKGAHPKTYFLSRLGTNVPSRDAFGINAWMGASTHPCIEEYDLMNKKEGRTLGPPFLLILVQMVSRSGATCRTVILLLL